MADYPSYTQLIGTRKANLDGTVLDRSVSGKPRLRTYYPVIRGEFNVEHEVDGPQKDALYAHFLAHRTVPFNFTFRGDNQVYSVMYVAAPNEVSVAGNDRWKVTNKLVTV